MKVVRFPEEFLKLASQFRECFSQPQFENFLRYIFGLIVNEEGRNVYDIASAYLEAVDQASLNNFLTDSPWSGSCVRDKRMGLINLAIQRRLPQSIPILLILDDIVVSKTGKCMQGAGYFFSTTEGKSVWSHNFVSSFIVARNIRAPLDIWQYRKKYDCIKNNIPFKKKTDAVADHIRAYTPPKGREVIVTMDSFYLCKKVIRPIKERGWEWVSRLKIDNRIIYLNDVQMTVADLIQEKSVSESEYRKCTVGKILFYATKPIEIYIPEVGPVQLILAKSLTGDQRKSDLPKVEPKIYATSSLKWPKRKVLSIYSKRTLIDNGYRDQKQNLGFGEYQMRKTNGIVKHANLVFTVHPILILMNLNRSKGRRFQTLGEICAWVKELATRETIKWAYEEFGKNVSLDEVLNSLGL